MTQLILLHGAGLGSWIWDRVMPQLQTSAVALDLPGRADGRNPADVTLAQCVASVVDAMRGRSILVGHSFSAEIALAAAAAKPSSVAAVALVGGVTPESGANFLSIMPAPARLFMKLVLRRSRDGVSLPASLVRKEYCNDLDEATTELVMSRVVREVPRLYSDRVEWSALPETLARAYVLLQNDASVSVKMQQKMIARVKATMIESLNTGHLPMLADPAGCAAALDRIAMSV